MFEREEWTLFRDLQGLSQKAGVPLNRLRRLVLKELADNALDAAVNCECEFTALPDGSYTIRDEGPGIEGGADAIARLFSIRRPLLSSKLLRLPTRGTLGNGLRVVVGAVIASEGSMAVTTRGERHRLTFDDEEQGNPIAEQLEDMVIQHAEDSRADLWVVPIERQSDQLLNGGGRG